MQDGPSAAARARSIDLLPTVAITLFVVSVIRMAWLSDDGFVTFRAFDNLIHGYGLVSNASERVLGFTNPLWGALVAIPMAFGVPMYGAAVGTGITCATLTAIVIARRAAPTALVAGVILSWCTLSSAFVDFSTSGLENPLAHLLLVLFFTEFFALRPRGDALRDRVGPWLVAALIGLNRLDHLLLVAPALVTLCFGDARESDAPFPLPRLAPLRPVLRRAAIGFAPLVLWLAFATFYYGFPFPNTAYAKLNTTIPSLQLVSQGGWYLVDAVKRDPLTVLVIVLALVTALRGTTREHVAVCGGLTLFLLYVVRVGGDFMAGRFLTAPFAVSVVWLGARFLPRCSLGDVLSVWGFTAVVGLFFSTTFATNEKLDCYIVPSGVVNERLCYTEFTGIGENVRILKYKQHGAYVDGATAKKNGTKVFEGLPGMGGVAAGPGVHVLDLYALTEPLLARIPYSAGSDFRTGHFRRAMPDGYMQTLETNRNVIRDPCIATYYDALSRVIHGPLFSVARFRAIVALNFGSLDYLLAGPCTLPPRPHA